jgi:MFS family permease
VQLGYTLSAISKPMMAFFFYPLWIFFARTLDRFGKGIRTAARDAMLSDESTPETKGRVFGFNRSMDTIGAVIGPVIALVYLYFNPHDYKTLFLITFLPGILVLVLTRLIKEKTISVKSIPKEKIGLFAFTAYWKKSPDQYKKLVIGLLLFALFNSSDAFLLLKLKESGFTDSVVIILYIFYNLVYAVLAYPVGILADKIGLKKIFIAGLIIFSTVYAGFAFSTNLIVLICLLLLYGLYAAASEGISKAWISNVVDKTETASAIGTYTGFQSIAALIASSTCGLLWYQFGSMVALLITAIVTLAVVIYLSKINFTQQNKNSIMQSYETVTAALNGLKKEGFTIDFNVAFDKFICSENKHELKPGEFEIVQVHRFEGDTNPSDEDVVYAVASKDGKLKGTFTGAFGTYADALSTEMIQQLSIHK